jgi:chemotaxis response regulator CheB
MIALYEAQPHQSVPGEPLHDRLDRGCAPPRDPVVGIGAPAGGLRALQQLFAHMPADSGMAFVVLLHLSAQHESRAVNVLQRSASIPVTQVTETTTIRPNHVHVMGPAKHRDLLSPGTSR